MGAPGAAAAVAAAAITRRHLHAEKSRSLALLQHHLPLGQARRESVQVTFWPASLRVPLPARVGAGGSLRPPPGDSPAALQLRSGV
jgi:hypothetical protein